MVASGNAIVSMPYFYGAPCVLGCYVVIRRPVTIAPTVPGGVSPITASVAGGASPEREDDILCRMRDIPIQHDTGNNEFPTCSRDLQCNLLPEEARPFAVDALLHAFNVSAMWNQYSLITLTREQFDELESKPESFHCYERACTMYEYRYMAASSELGVYGERGRVQLHASAKVALASKREHYLMFAEVNDLLCRIESLRPPEKQKPFDELLLRFMHQGRVVWPGPGRVKVLRELSKELRSHLDAA